MGNVFRRYKQMPEDPLEKRPYSPLSSELDLDGTTSAPVEMETVRDVESDKNWFKGHTRFDVPSKPFSLKWCKSWIVPVSCLIALLTVVAITSSALTIAYTKSKACDSCVTREQLYRYVNETVSQLQRREGENCGCNNSLTVQLREDVSSIREQMLSLQSNNLHLSGVVTAVQNNITVMNDQLDVIETKIDNLTKQGNSLEADLSSVRASESLLTRKVNVLEAFTGNLSAVDHLQNINEALDHGNMSELIMHVRSTVTVLSGRQDRIDNQMSSLQRNLSQLGSEVHSLQDSVQQQSATAQAITSYSTRLDQVQSSVTSLSTKVHGPVNLYSGCRKENVSCTIDPIRRDDYWRDCASGYLSIDIQGWYTLDYQCVYESESRMNMEALTPFISHGRVRCDCDITYPGDNNEHHRPVPRDVHGTCFLVVTRCPSSQTLFSN